MDIRKETAKMNIFEREGFYEKEVDKLQAALKVAEEALRRVVNEKEFWGGPYEGGIIQAKVALAEIARIKDKP